MNSKRLQIISSCINNTMQVIDIGTDHAYLPILLKKKNIEVLATDINENALKIAHKNIQKYHLDIKTILSDGLENIDTSFYNTLVIMGMGFQTIKHILDNKEKLKPIKTIFLQSNNDYEKLRYYMNINDWTLETEIIIEEKKKIYHLMKYQKKRETLTKEEIILGKYQPQYQKYYLAEHQKLTNILKQIPNNNNKKINEKLKALESYLAKDNN